MKWTTLLDVFFPTTAQLRRNSNILVKFSSFLKVHTLYHPRKKGMSRLFWRGFRFINCLFDWHPDLNSYEKKIKRWLLSQGIILPEAAKNSRVMWVSSRICFFDVWGNFLPQVVMIYNPQNLRWFTWSHDGFQVRFISISRSLKLQVNHVKLQGCTKN